MKKLSIGVASALAACAVAAGLSQAGIRPGTSAGVAPDAAVQAKGAERKTSYAKDETTEVLIDAPAVSADEIARIVKHGDHWHVFTKDGREIITYSDPSKASNISQLTNTASVVSADQLRHVSGSDVVSILRHGNHWHILLADGREFISYEDPSGLYPGVTVGEYTGSHGSHGQQGGTHEASHVEHHDDHQGGGGSSDHHHHGFVQVVGIDELSRKPIVRILRHGDHYHAYTADGTEYVTHDDPSSAFPGITIGEYEGTHGGGTHDPASPEGPVEQDPNDPKRVVSIEHHDDHWHLHHADGSESVSYTDPSPLYPGVPVSEYDENQGHHFDPLQKDELFAYEDVKAEMLVPLEDITYGNVIHTVRYDNEKGFVIPHHDHYHYVSIKTIIQLCKYADGPFGGHDAKSVVATLKYLVEHPEARPEGSDGWGSSAEIVQPGNGGDAGHGGNGGSEGGGGHAGEKTVTRVVHDGSRWLAYYSDGSCDPVSRNPEGRYPGIPIEEAPADPNVGMSDEEIVERYCAEYGMTADEFDEALLSLPAVPLSSIGFHADGTVTIHGRTYQFKSLVSHDDPGDGHGPAEEDDSVDEREDVEESEPAEEIAPVEGRSVPDVSDAVVPEHSETADEGVRPRPLEEGLPEDAEPLREADK
ncbi:hypothetical protein [Olsenella urininfantis]|uniref:hypothetical protein n=1 Tax=Olsenella urininfantis TaxID=1871033 RepID=UPI0009870854|nr:hypothetical protein [Olsenella urininfantis]